MATSQTTRVIDGLRRAALRGDRAGLDEGDDPDRPGRATEDDGRVVRQDGKPAFGKCIYELDGDTLKFCYGEPDRPREFKTAPDSDMKLYVWRRKGAAGR